MKDFKDSYAQKKWESVAKRHATKKAYLAALKSMAYSSVDAVKFHQFLVDLVEHDVLKLEEQYPQLK